MNPEPPNTVATLRAAIAAISCNFAGGLIGGARTSLKRDDRRFAIDAPIDATPRQGYTARPPDGPASGPPVAQVAELVDAQVSGTCGRKVVEVRVFSWAPEQLPVVSHRWSIISGQSSVVSRDQ